MSRKPAKPARTGLSERGLGVPVAEGDVREASTLEAMRSILFFFLSRAEGSADNYDTRKGYGLICPFNSLKWGPVG